MSSTKPLYFDTDCLSAFLWVNSEGLLYQLYPGRIMVPEQVYVELSAVPVLISRLDRMCSAGDAQRVALQLGSDAYALYIRN